mmetsp:Transcript_90878/g.291343  ORF Transcript_90878/g.291343 Transcript_90878/m.291343 type:complete len:290 (+) Transcript_90878:807-1676(+)
MCAQLEYQEGHVHEAHDQCDDARQADFVRESGIGHVRVDRRQCEREGGQHQATNVGACPGRVECGLFVHQARAKEGHSEHQQQVGENRADQRLLHDADETGPDRIDGDDHLNRIAEGGVQETAHHLPGVRGERLGESAEHSRERHDGNEVQEEGGQATPIALAGRDAYRDTHQQNVDRLNEDTLQAPALLRHPSPFRQRRAGVGFARQRLRGAVLTIDHLEAPGVVLVGAASARRRPAFRVEGTRRHAPRTSLRVRRVRVRVRDRVRHRHGAVRRKGTQAGFEQSFLLR